MSSEETKQAAPQPEPKPEQTPAEEQEKKPETAAKAAEPETAEASAKPEGQESAKEQKKHFGKKKSEADALREQLDAAVKEAAKQKDLLMRTAAEYDNFRKRTEREKNALYAAATADTVAAFLDVADNLERALAQKDCAVEDLRKGVEMVQRQMAAALEKLGVKELGKKGEPFDAQYHNAVSHIEDETLGENVISEVYQKGYILGERVVRHAMVQVAN